MKKPRMLLWRTFSDLMPVALDVAAPRAPAITLRLSSRSARASSSSARKPCAHEAAVAAQVRRLVDERARRAASASSPPRRAQRAGDARRAPPAGPMAPAPSRSSSRAGARPPRARRARPRDRAAPPRPKREPRDGAGDVGRGPQRGAHVARAALVARRGSRRRRAARRSRAASRSGLASRAASSRAPGPVTVRSMAASRLPCLLAATSSAAARGSRGVGGVDDAAIAPEPPRRGGRSTGLRAELGQLDVLEQRADGGQLGARERRRSRRDRRRRAAPSASRSPARLSKEAPGTGVARRAGDADPRARRSASASSASAAITSPGARRTSSPARSAPATSPTSNSPVEMSSEASASIGRAGAVAGLARPEERGQIVARLGIEQACPRSACRA